MPYNEYFEKFPYLIWTEEGTGNEYILQDITARIVIDPESLRDKVLFDDVYVSDSDSPELIAQQYYDDYNYSWVVLFVNNLFDRDFDWPMNSNQFSEYILDKYGTLDVANSEKHYFIQINDSEWVEVDYSQYLNTVPEKRKMKTAYEIEQERNENKRKLRLLKKEYLGTLVNFFNEKLKVK